MKTKYIFATLVVFALVSCKGVVTYKTDLPDLTANHGAPSITAIYDIYDDEMETPLEEGSLAQLLHIKGENLAKPLSITFNGIEADLSKCYCETYDGYVPIPRVLPDNVNNSLVYRTAEGVVTYFFSVTIPQFKLEGLKNEFALPGSTVAVNGDFFDLFQFGVEGSDASIKTDDGTEVEVASVSEEGMSIVIPEGTPDNSFLTFSWTDVTLGPQTKKIPYRQTSALLMGDFSNTGFWDDGLKAKHLSNGTFDGDPEYLGYPFFRFNTDIPAWTWYSIGMGDGFPLDYDWATMMDKLVFKMEVWTDPSKPIPAYTGNCGIFLQFNLKANVPVNMGGAAYNTGGEWKTYSCPLADVASEMPALGDYWGFALTIQPPSDWSVNCALANFRIEPASY